MKKTLIDFLDKKFKLKEAKISIKQLNNTIVSEYQKHLKEKGISSRKGYYTNENLAQLTFKVDGVSFTLDSSAEYTGSRLKIRSLSLHSEYCKVDINPNNVVVALQSLDVLVKKQIFVTKEIKTLKNTYRAFFGPKTFITDNNTEYKLPMPGFDNTDFDGLKFLISWDDFFSRRIWKLIVIAEVYPLDEEVLFEEEFSTLNETCLKAQELIKNKSFINEFNDLFHRAENEQRGWEENDEEI